MKSPEIKKLDELVTEFIAEERDRCFYILCEYFRYIKTIPELNEVLEKLETDFKTKDISENYKMGDMENLKSIDIKNDKILFNIWFIYGYLDNLADGLEKMIPLFQMGGSKELLNQVQQIYIPELQKNQESVKEIAPMIKKETFNRYLKNLNDFLVNELSAREFLGAKDRTDGISYDKEEQILHINHYSIPIVARGENNNSHFLLCCLFELSKELDEIWSYKDLSESKYFTGDNAIWKKYYDAAMLVKKKISEYGDPSISDFLIIISGENGHVRINEKYI